MKQSLSLFAVVAIGLNLIACSPSEKISGAPQSQEEAGILIKGSAQQTEAVIAASSAYRVISEKHGIYEVHGLNASDIRALAPKLQVEANQFYEKVIQKKDRQPPWHMDLTLEDQVQTTLPPLLQGCNMESEQLPVAEIDTNNNSLNNKATAELGSVIDLNSNNSKAHSAEAPIVERRWEIFAPAKSKVEAGVRPGSSLDFTPDNVGLHQVALVVKDSKGACGIQVATFIVSWNPDMNLPTAGEEKPSVDLQHFHHLPLVDAEQAWQKSKGKGVTIAVLDTGLNYNHNAIRFNLAVNQRELHNSSVSDIDNNGFKNDALGWDFINDDNRPYDDEGHGSHVSGLAASHIFGLAPDAKVLPVKVLNGAGGGDAGSILAGIYYAADNGATVINGSLGAPIESFKMLQEGLEYAQSKGVVSIISAGNGDERGIGMDLGKPGIDIWPAELNVASIVTIAATNESNSLTTYSNYGDQEVDVAAPGGSATKPLWSLATQNAQDHNFAPSMGTSMSAPVVAGIAALVQSVQPGITPLQVKKTLIESGQDTQALEGKVVSEKIINALDAINIVSP